jgi:Electron transfer DM13
MSEPANRFSKRPVVLSVLALVVAFGLWYAFRPEKLFVNKKVNEPAPVTLGQLTPLYTGTFHTDARDTSGRATVYRQPNGSRLLTLSNFSTANETSLTVILLDGSSMANGEPFTPAESNHRDIGEIKTSQGEQNYALPADVDFNRFNTVAIYSAGLHTVFGTAKLDAF